MKLGIVYPQTELGGDPHAVHDIGLATEEFGYDYLLAYDHVVGADHSDRDPPLLGPYTDKDPFHDPFVMFAYLAALTERIEFATGVLILPQRQTVLVAKQAADVDLLSGERLRLGVGVGWNHVEYTALGQDYSTRGARADEQIDFLRRLWTEPLIEWAGHFDRIERGNVVPRPRRSIPIWIGGFSEPAYRRGALQGDGFIFTGSLEHAATGLERITVLAAESGRDLEGFGKEYFDVFPTSIEDTIASIAAWREAGGTHFAVCSMGMGLDSTEAHLDFFASVKAAADA